MEKKKIAGHELDGLERYLEDVRHMVVFDVLDHLSPVGWKGERVRLLVSDSGLKRALASARDNHIHILAYAQVVKGQNSHHKRFGWKEESAWLYLESKKLKTTRS